MRRINVLFFLLVLTSILTSTRTNAADPLRAPAAPLIAVDPYFSVWSTTDDLADSATTHWTGTEKSLCSFVKIDGKNFRLMGVAPEFDEVAPKMKQTNLEIRATNTTYTFEGSGVCVALTFTNPNLPTDLDLLSSPYTLVTWKVRSSDGKPRDVKIYFDASAEMCVDSPEQSVVGVRESTKALDILKFGTSEQNVLGKSGDNVRIDWGYFIVATDKEQAQSRLTSETEARASFLEKGILPEKDDVDYPRAANVNRPVVATTFDLGRVQDADVEKTLTLAYDDLYSAEYFGEKCQAYWRRSGASINEALEAARKSREDVMKRCAQFDREQWERATRLGGENFASLCAMAYPQSIAAQKLITLPNGKTAMIAKENRSGGFVATVDVIYPTSPIFIFYNKELLKATLVPPLEYAASGRWPWPYASHDIGFYPKMNGQLYGGGEKTEEKQMPVEESANMLILCDVATRLDGNVDFVNEYLPILVKWTDYLVEKGFDPEDQLCTDDFAGRLARNANLSIKATIAIACFADICARADESELAAKYRAIAERYAKDWEKLAASGDHYVLAFGNPDSWSQKYNLVWDKLLDLNLFSPEIARKEVAFYKTQTNEFGLPLDSRKEFTKVDWQVWTATLADSREDFDALMKGVYNFVSATEPRVPMTDWYHSDSAKECNMHARSVVGGFFIKFLESERR